MPLATLAQYKVFNDYKAELKTATVKSKASALPFRYVKEFQFDSVKKPLLLIGKLPPALLTELKENASTVKIKAQGLCRLVGESLEFEVDKGSLEEDDAGRALSAAGVARTPKVVAKLSDGSSAKARELDKSDLVRRLGGLETRLEKLPSSTPVPVTKALQALVLKLRSQTDDDEAPATTQEMLDQLERGLVAVERQVAIAKSKADSEDEAALGNGGSDEEAQQRAKRLENANKAVDAKVGPAKGEMPARRTTPAAELKHPFGVIAASVEKVETLAASYAKDPNGFLLMSKQVSASSAALEALARTAPPVTDADSARLDEAIKDLRLRLRKLGAIAEKLKPENMAKYIKERQTVLGHDIGNKKDVPQEGRIGADVEMQLGGLERSPAPEVEFTPGKFSPYQGSDPETPHQFDVFGPTPDIVKKVILIAARKLYPELKAPVGNDALWAELRKLQAPAPAFQVAPMAAAIGVDPLPIIEQYLTQAKFFASLEHHFAKSKDKKPTIVPFDISGLGLWPALLDHVKSEAQRRFPKQHHLILWQDK